MNTQCIARRGAAAAAVLLAGLAAAGCGSTCVATGNRIIVDVSAGANLNDSQGSGPHVKYRVWAVKDPATFELLASQRESAVALTDAQQDAARIASGFGQPLFGGGANPGWITPGSTPQSLTPTQVTVDQQFAAIGIVVLYPQPGVSIMRLDCAKRPGYEAKDGTHHVSFRLDGTTVQPGP